MSFVLQVASSPDRDALVTEIWWNDLMVAEMRRGSGGHRYISIRVRHERLGHSDLRNGLL